MLLSPNWSQKRRGVTKPKREGVAGTTIAAYFSLSHGVILSLLSILSSISCWYSVDFFSSKQENITLLIKRQSSKNYILLLTTNIQNGRNNRTPRRQIHQHTPRKLNREPWENRRPQECAAELELAWISSSGVAGEVGGGWQVSFSYCFWGWGLSNYYSR